jgi:hypothetical protein
MDGRQLGSLALLLAACAADGPGDPSVPLPLPVSDFPVSFTGEDDTFHAERLVLWLNWSEESDGYAAITADYYAEDPEGRGVRPFPSDGIEISIFDDPPLVDGRIHIVLGEESGRLHGERFPLRSADVFLAPDGTITGTLVSPGFDDPFVEVHEDTEVEVAGPIVIGCHNAPTPPVLELADGSRAVFDCPRGDFATFVIEPPGP